MTSDIIIGVDAGTSIIKSVAFGLDGQMLASASLPNTYEVLPDGGAEQDMARTWADVRQTLRALKDKVPNLVSRTAAIAITAQGDGTWLIDAEGEPVAPAWLWLDVRATDLAEEVLAKPDYPRHYATTGTALNACQQSIHLAWLKRHRPEIPQRATTAFHCKDWLYFKMTGVRATDPSEVVYTYGNFRIRDYAMELLDRIGIAEERRLLPPIVDGAVSSHPLTEHAADELGWKAGTPAVLGYLDVLCVGVGAGLLSPGADRGCTILGSTGMHMRLARTAEDVVLNPSRSGYTMPLPGVPMLAQMQSNMAASLNVDWVVDIARGILSAAGIEKSREALLTETEDAVAAARPGVIYHPYISEAGERGPFLDRHARAQLFGLSQRTDFPALLRSVYEGLAMAARDCYVAMGGVPAEVHLAGGVAKSRVMRQILASVLNAPVRTVTREEAGAAGAAMIAAVQLGIFPDMQSCANAWVDRFLGEPVLPIPGLVDAYDHQYEIYRNLREAAGPSWRNLAAMKRGEQL